MLRVILAALALTGLTVVMHGVGTVTIVGRVVAAWVRRGDHRSRLGAELFMARVVSLLLLLNLAEAGVWALFYRLVGGLPDMETAAYFSLTSYTTVGYGDMVLPEPWRLLGPIEAAVGILMLGWSTGILVAGIAMVYRELFGVAGAGPPSRPDAGDRTRIVP